MRSWQRKKDGEPTDGEELDSSSEVILAAIANLKSDFSSKLEGVLLTIENVRKDVNECVKWVNHAEIQISAAENSITSLQAKVQTLKNKNKDLEEKVLDLEARSRQPEGKDACTFLENWLPEVLNLAPLRAALTLETHRVGQRNTSNNAAPRIPIMKFLNYRVYDELPGSLQEPFGEILFKKQKEFDATRLQLHSTGIWYGMIHNSHTRI